MQKSEKLPLSLVALEQPRPLEVPALEDVDEISTKYAIMVDGKQNNLYCTFK